METDGSHSRPPVADKHESYLALDQWFSTHGRSYQVHWTAREILFRCEVPQGIAGELERSDGRLQLHGADCQIEDLDGRHYLNARLSLAPPYRPSYHLHGALFLLTCLTTVTCGATGIGDPKTIARIFGLLVSACFESFYGVAGKAFPDFLVVILNGVCFAVPLLGILTVHEFGHYFAALRHRVTATLPFYIPVPMGIGTMGAVIGLRSPMVHRRTVLDIGIAGPLAGFAVALPVFAYGISLSTVEPLARYHGMTLFQEGKSLLYLGLLWVLKGPIPAGHDIMLHPFAWAGWFGLFVTALNLIPVGQLDGGHVVYAMFGERHRKVARLVFVALLGLIIVWEGYIFFTLLLFFLVKLDHPPAIDDRIELDARRFCLGWLALLVFALTFVPVPMRILVIGG
jgi:membrane-associated protease RseP (regulator of RpoE activity)